MGFGWLLIELRESERLHFYCKLKGFFYAESLFLSKKKVGFFLLLSLLLFVRLLVVISSLPNAGARGCDFFFFFWENTKQHAQIINTISSFQKM